MTSGQEAEAEEEALLWDETHEALEALAGLKLGVPPAKPAGRAAPPAGAGAGAEAEALPSPPLSRARAGRVLGSGQDPRAAHMGRESPGASPSSSSPLPPPFPPRPASPPPDSPDRRS